MHLTWSGKGKQFLIGIHKFLLFMEIVWNEEFWFTGAVVK